MKRSEIVAFEKQSKKTLAKIPGKKFDVAWAAFQGVLAILNKDVEEDLPVPAKKATPAPEKKPLLPKAKVKLLPKKK